MKVRVLMAILYECDPDADVMPYTEWADGGWNLATNDLMVHNPDGRVDRFIDLAWEEENEK